MPLFDDSKKLEKALGEEAAAVLAHVFEQADAKWRQELATKSDLIERTAALENRISAEVASVRVEIQAVKNELIKWMMGGFVVLGGFLPAAMAFLK